MGRWLCAALVVPLQAPLGHVMDGILLVVILHGWREALEFVQLATGSVNTPSRRERPGLVWSDVADGLYVHGGWDGAYQNDLWFWSRQACWKGALKGLAPPGGQLGGAYRQWHRPCAEWLRFCLERCRGRLLRLRGLGRRHLRRPSGSHVAHTGSAFSDVWHYSRQAGRFGRFGSGASGQQLGGGHSEWHGTPGGAIHGNGVVRRGRWLLHLRGTHREWRLGRRSQRGDHGLSSMSILKSGQSPKPLL